MARKKKIKPTPPFRSLFEEGVAKTLTELKVKFRYEGKHDVMVYEKPATKHKYTPDFVLPNGIVVETKGRLTTSDRQKMILVVEHNPSKDIRFVFQRAKNPIRKGSKTTYGMWADKNGFLWADGEIPQAWLNETPKRNSKVT
jgi:hypothetical protein